MSTKEKEITNIAGLMQNKINPPEATAQIDFIKEVMASQMRSGVHYGKVGGVLKPTLLKPGAELLNVIFRLCPEYEIVNIERNENGFTNYLIRCTLIHIPSSSKVATGLGSCNSFEPKYRYRWLEMPKPDEETIARKKALKKGKFGEDFNDKGKWVWLEKVQNEDLFELDNTLLKMACKRALIAAELNGTAASEVFTQDLEDTLDEDYHKKEPYSDSDKGKPRSQEDEFSALKALDLSAEVKDGFIGVQGKTYGKTDKLKELGYKYHKEKKIWFKKAA